MSLFIITNSDEIKKSKFNIDVTLQSPNSLIEDAKDSLGDPILLFHHKTSDFINIRRKVCDKLQQYRIDLT